MGDFILGMFYPDGDYYLRLHFICKYMLPLI